jgi:hypothetical protein
LKKTAVPLPPLTSVNHEVITEMRILSLVAVCWRTLVDYR